MILELTITFILLLPNRNVARHVPHCVLKCKDAHMQQMEKEWSLNFAFPLLSLLKATGNETAAHNRAIQICRSNELLIECLAKCNKTNERKIIELGLLPWKEICSNLHVLQAEFPCWRLNINNLTSNCRKQSYELRERIKYLAISESSSDLQRVCLSMDRFAECSIQNYGYHCGRSSESFIDRLFWISHNAIYDMLMIKWPVLPVSCNIDFSRRKLNMLNSFHLNNQQCYYKAYKLLIACIIAFSFMIRNY
ncbi:CD-NTase-associated protein [Dirofilaria immitis]